MRIIFVRHGHPNYKLDCLTEEGHRQAEAAARRLGNERFAKIYASSCGRAFETAEHIALPRGLSVEKCEFMREIKWGSVDEEQIHLNGHPWNTVNHMVANGKSVLDTDWASQEPFCRNMVVNAAQRVADAFDQWLAKLGYEREGYYYRVRSNNPSTVAMVSHGGSSSAVMSRLFNLPFPFVCTAIQPDFTAISVVSFHGDEGTLISPHMELLNDTRHIEDVQNEATYDQ